MKVSATGMGIGRWLNVHQIPRPRSDGSPVRQPAEKSRFQGNPVRGPAQDNGEQDPETEEVLKTLKNHFIVNIRACFQHKVYAFVVSFELMRPF